MILTGIRLLLVFCLSGFFAVSAQSEPYKIETSAEVYAPDKFPRFDLDLPAASIEALKSVRQRTDPNQDVYVKGNFTYDKGGKAEVVRNVGVRIKGEGSFQTFDKKPALKIKFNKFVKDQQFRGLKRLTVNNNYDDPTFLAERLAYAVYREVGVPAPRCNSALVYVNGEFFGVYTNIEAEDKQFLKRWFDDHRGNLYEKNGYEDFDIGSESGFDLETNEKTNDTSDLTELLAVINSATDRDTYLEDLGKRIDTDRLLKFMAVEGMVNQWDSLSFTIWWTHNFRIYHDPGSQKFVFIPWGHDLCMKPSLLSSRPFIPMLDVMRRGDRAGNAVSSSVLFRRCLASPKARSAYKSAIDEVIKAWERLDMESAANRHYAQIRRYVYMDKRKTTEQHGLLGNEQFEAAYRQLLLTIRGRVAAVRKDLSRN